MCSVLVCVPSRLVRCKYIYIYIIYAVHIMSSPQFDKVFKKIRKQREEKMTRRAFLLSMFLRAVCITYIVIVVLYTIKVKLRYFI